MNTPDLDRLSTLDRLALADTETRQAILKKANRQLLEAIVNRDWSIAARPAQKPPPGDWLGWFIMAGRGFGKTITGANWSLERIRILRGRGVETVRWALVAPKFGDVRDTMVEGVTGLQAVLPPSELRNGSWEDSWNRSLAELTLHDGSKLKGFSSERPASLRGPQHHGAWVDEPGWLADAHLGLADETGSTIANLLLGLRLEPDPRMVLTGTPKPNRLVIELDRDARFVTTTGSTYENLHNLAPAYREAVVDPFEGTRLGDQELHGRILMDLGGVLSVEKFQRVRIGPDGWQHWPGLRYWDLAATEPSPSNTNPDWTAGVLVHREPASVGEARYHIDDIIRLRGNPASVEAKILAAHAADPLTIPYGIEQERGSAGTHVVSHYKKLLVGRRVEGNRPTGDKKSRVEQSVALSSQKGLVTVSERDWTQAFLDEVLVFTGEDGIHDDMVDAAAGAWELLGGRAAPSGDSYDAMQRVSLRR